jgi:acetyl-CoA carboxylase biotin carboxylase subunit
MTSDKGPRTKIVFKKILVANRGEIAIRIIRACQELDIATVAVYSEADAESLHTVLAGEAVLIGPPAPAESYLNGQQIVEVARQRNCDAIHPGYGFLAENADFAEAVRSASMTFIGPGPEAIRLMGSKTAARTVMQKAGVPIVPGYQGSDDDDMLGAQAEKIGFPLLVKATAGGGGKGMRLVETGLALPAALESARREALSAFGDDRIYLEKYIASPHHIEFQIIGDELGHIVHLFERECSVQRRHQKIIEESPSPFLDEQLRQRMGESAIAAARAVNYVNAGTVEFLVDAERNFYFLEMNTRLQVEHPVTEMITGVDLVKLQLRVAAGKPLSFRQADLSQRGHAIECRIYAEDPANNFLPDIGCVLCAVEPQGPGIRIDSGVTSGNEITLHYDPMIAKLVVQGESRSDARQKMSWALKQYIILGVTTNIPFLQDIMNHEGFRRGETTTDFVEQYFAGWQPGQVAPPDLALAAAAISELFEEKARTGSDKIPVGQIGDPYSPWQHTNRFRIGT